jgi:hypothetical protein
MMVKVHIVVFHITTLCILRDANQCSRGIYHLHFQGTVHEGRLQ